MEPIQQMQGTAAVAKLLQNVIRPGPTAAANADPGYFRSRGSSSRLSVASQTWRGPSTAKFAAAAAAAAAIFFLHGLRAIFVNFVTFSTKHGSTSDKACVRLVGSRYAQPTRIAGREAVFEFLRQKLGAYPFIYI